MGKRRRPRRRTGKRGRPSKIDEPVRKLLLEGIRVGLSTEDAVIWACDQGVGTVGERTVRDWMNRGDEAGELFRRDLMRARVQGSMLRLAQIMEAARTGRVTKHYDAQGNVVREVVEPGDWRAAAWLQSKLHPEAFGADTNPLYVLRQLQRLAKSLPGDDERAAFQHLMDVVARSLAKLKPFGAAAQIPDEEADEAALRTELKGEGLDEAGVDRAIELIQLIENAGNGRGKLGPGHAGNGSTPAPPGSNGDPPAPGS